MMGLVFLGDTRDHCPGLAFPLSLSPSLTPLSRDVVQAHCEIDGSQDRTLPASSILDFQPLEL